MRVIPQLFSAQLNSKPIAKHFRWSHPRCEHSYCEERVRNKVNLRPLASPFGQPLRPLALTCDDLHSLWSGSNLHASQRKFFTVWPPSASQRNLMQVDHTSFAVIANH